MGTVQWLRSELDTTPLPGKVRWVRSELDSTAITAPVVRWVRSELNSTAPVTPKVRWTRSEMITTRAVAIVPLTSLANILPETNVTFTALMTTGDIADSYTWRQISGPAVTFNGTGNTRTFRAPSSMSTISVVIGVTATIGTKTSPEQQATVTVLPQTKWMYINGAWVGRQPAVFL